MRKKKHIPGKTSRFRITIEPAKDNYNCTVYDIITEAPSADKAIENIDSILCFDFIVKEIKKYKKYTYKT